MSWGGIISGGIFPSVILSKYKDPKPVNLNDYSSYRLNVYGTASGSSLPVSMYIPWQPNIRSDFSNISFFRNGQLVPFFIERFQPNRYALVHIKPPVIVNGTDPNVKMVVDYNMVYNQYCSINTYQYFFRATSYDPFLNYMNLSNLTFTSNGTRIRYVGTAVGGMSMGPVLTNAGVVEFLYNQPTCYRNRMVLTDQIFGGAGVIGMDYGVFGSTPKVFWGAYYETLATNTWYKMQFIVDGTTMTWNVLNADTNAVVATHSYTGAAVVKTLRYLSFAATESTSSDYYVLNIVSRDLGTPPYWSQIDTYDYKNCILDMPMDVLSGSTVYDARPSAETQNNGTLVSMVQSLPSEGKIGKAIKSSADASVITLTTPIAEPNLFISFWYYGSSVARVRTLLAADVTYQHLCLNTNSNEIGFWNNGFVGSGYSLTANTWQHIVVAKQNTAQQIYVDGTCVMNVTNSFNNADHPLLYIGNATNNSGTLGMNGRIDQLRVFKGIPTANHFNILPYV